MTKKKESKKQEKSVLNKNQRVLLTKADVAHLLQISERMVENLAKTKTLNPVKVGRLVRYKMVDVITYAESLKSDDKTKGEQ